MYCIQQSIYCIANRIPIGILIILITFNPSEESCGFFRNTAYTRTLLNPDELGNLAPIAAVIPFAAQAL